MPFASSEWLDGLALATRPKANEGSVRMMSAGATNAAETKAIVQRETEAQEEARKKLSKGKARGFDCFTDLWIHDEAIWYHIETKLLNFFNEICLVASFYLTFPRLLIS